MKTFKPNSITAALISSGMLLSSGIAYAQEAQEQQEQQAEEQQVEVIEVSGFRGSVIESINTKRFSSNVVEAISAEDIGKLPDSSIAESIARLPGLAAQRLDGRASRVTIRGFGENESATTFNGREQVSIGDNRGVEFDLYPSEIMSGVTVYKTPDATIEAEGIAGVIDMQTVSPLKKGERVVQVNLQAEKTGLGKLNPDGNDTGYRATLSYIDQFNDDKVGVAVAITTMDSPNQEKRWNSWGYPGFTYEGDSYSILGGAKPFVRSSSLKRDSIMGVVEFLPSDKLKMTVDALYVDFSDEKILRGIEIPFAWGQGSISADSATVDPATGFVTSATTVGQRVVVRNDLETRDAKLNQLGFNAEYEVSDSLSLEFDASYSKVERDIWSFESYAGTGRGDSEGVADTLGYTFDGGNTGAHFSHQLDYSDFNLIQMGGPLTWGWSAALNDKFNLAGTPYENAAQDGFINAPEIDDELTSLKLAATQAVEAGPFDNSHVGLSHRDREKTKKSNGYYMTLDAFPGMLVVPEEYRLGSVSLDFIGMGDMIAYDSGAMLADGYYDLTAENLTGIQHLTKSWSVNETVTAAYVQGDFDTEVGGMTLTGNVGVRYVHTKQQSKGFAGTVVDGLVVANPPDISHSYNNLLPSLNMSLRIDDEQTLRFGAAKTLSRARLDEMNASVQTSYSQQPNAQGYNWSVSGGNPALEPKTAVGFDISYENYFAPEGYFSLAFFHKNLTDWIFDGSSEIDMTGIADPATGDVPSNPIGQLNGKVNAGGGTLWGTEFALAVPMNMLSESLDGFGVLASYTVVNSDITDNNGNAYELPGLSDSIMTFTGYYEKNGFSARVSMRKRDDFKGDVYGIGFDTVQVDVVGETIWDAQIGYDFGEAGHKDLEGLSVFLQAQNITNEPFISLSGDNALQVRDYQEYGSVYLLGASYKF